MIREDSKPSQKLSMGVGWHKCISSSWIPDLLGCEWRIIDGEVNMNPINIPVKYGAIWGPEMGSRYQQISIALLSWEGM